MRLTPGEADAARRAIEAASTPAARSTLNAAVRAQADIARMTALQPADPFAGIHQALKAASAPPVEILRMPDPLAGMRELLRQHTLVDRAASTGIAAALFSGIASPTVPSPLAAVLAPAAGWGRGPAINLTGSSNVSAVAAIAAGLPQLRGRTVAEMIGSAASAGVLDTGLRRAFIRNDAAVAALVAGLPATKITPGVLGSTRAAAAGLDLASMGIRTRLDVTSVLSDRTSALRSGLATAGLLSGQIERAGVRLNRLTSPDWAALPVDSLSTLARLSGQPMATTLDTRDLFSVARGAYAMTAFSARAAARATGVEVDDDSEQTVEEWAAGSASIELQDALAALHPQLANKLRGAWNTYRGRGPDYLGQAGTSAVELIDHGLRLIAPPSDVLAFGRDRGLSGDRYVTDRGKPTVRLKLLYILRDRPMAAEAVEAQIKALTKARDLIQKSKHGLDFDDDLLLGQQLLVVENVFTVILLP